MPKLLVSMQNV